MLHVVLQINNWKVSDSAIFGTKKEQSATKSNCCDLNQNIPKRIDPSFKSDPMPGETIQSIKPKAIQGIEIAAAYHPSIQLYPKAPEGVDHEMNAALSRLTPAVLRELVISCSINVPESRGFLKESIISLLQSNREARFRYLVGKVKRSHMKAMISAFQAKIAELGENDWEEQHCLVIQLCRELEPFLFGAYELGCDHKKYYPLCIEVFAIAIEAAGEMVRLQTQFDVEEALLDWKPRFKMCPPSFANAKGFVQCILRMWSHVLHTASYDSALSENLLRKYFSWTSARDTNRELQTHLEHFYPTNTMPRNKALELYNSM